MKKKLSSIFTICFYFTEDIDPTVGRFRNLVQSAIIPNKVTIQIH